MARKGTSSRLGNVFEKSIVVEPVKRFRDAAVANSKAGLADILITHLQQQPEKVPVALNQLLSLLRKQDVSVESHLQKGA
jgi:hypothetical protein